MCENCKNSWNCKERLAYEALSKIGDAKCSGYEPNDMPDKKLTDNEIPDIKELLKYKAKVGCQNCDLIGKGYCSTCVNSLIKSFIELFDRLQAENERLKKGWKADVLLTADAKAEAYKEYAEMLCEDRVANDPVVIAAKCLLKELVGDTQ